MLDVIYEDNHLIVVNKPAGLLTQPTDEEQDSLETQTKAWIKEKYQKPGNVFLGVVHRLDRPVSGLVVFAKTSKALSRLNESVRGKHVQKIYRALVEGKPSKNSDTLEHYLRHDDFRAYVSTKQDPEAKLARLHYEVLEEKGDCSLLQIELETGRYHQIRAQLAAMGYPIVGDSKYGSKKIFPKGIIALHHYRWSGEHPVTKDPITFEVKESSWDSHL